MAGALIKLTDAGRAALVGPGNVGTVTRTVVSIGIATAPFEHNNGLTVLPNERAPRITALAGKNIAADTIHVTMRDDSTDQYTMYGFGLYLDNGVLLGTYSQPTPIVEKSSLSWMVTSADIQFATIDAAAIVFGDASFINPPATTEVLGVVELATGDEAQAGIDSTRVVTPAGLRRFGSQFGGVSALNANTDLSPWYSGRAIQWFGPDGGVLRLPSGSSVPTGGVFYIYNQGAGALVIGLASQSDFFWTTASRTTITLQRGENIIITSRGTTEYDIAGGTASAKYVPRTLIGRDTDDGQNTLQVGGNTAVSGNLRVDGVTTFGNQAAAAWANADAVAAYFYGPKSLYLGAANASGFLAFVTGNSERARIHQSGRVLIGTSNDDGTNLLQVAGDAALSGGAYRTTRFGIPGAIILNSAGGSSAAPTAIAGSNSIGVLVARGYDGNTYRDVASISAVSDDAITPTSSPGYLILATTAPGSVAAAERARVTSSGRILVGTQTDDGSSRLQVAGNARVIGEVQSVANNTYRSIAGNYGVFVRNDGANFYWMQTAYGDQYGGYNNYRPFFWNLTTGAVRIDETGASTTFGGPVIVNNAAPLALRGAAGTQRELQFQTGSVPRIKIVVDALGETGANAGSDFYIQTMTDAGAWLANPLKISRNTSRVTIGNGMDVMGTLNLNRTAGEGQFGVGQNDGYFFGNANEIGWYSPTKGKWSYDFLARNLLVETYPVHHTGNLPDPLRRSGGDMTGQLRIAEGTQNVPGLAFVNDGAPDTGLWHISDGVFGVSCNTVEVARFTPSGMQLSGAPTAPTPALGDNGGKIATTGFVQATIKDALIGQIVLEPRTSARAGYLKANGALLNRADYPSLWAYAQASGALSTEANWAAGWHGTFSTGNGATTFRIPNLCGEHIRCADDGRGVDTGRGVGSYQGPQNMSHAHGASATAVGDHGHTAWTDAQGWHGHGVSDPTHSHTYDVPPPATDGDAQGAASGASWLDLTKYGQRGTYGSYTGISINGDGTHSHNVGVGGAGAHNHTITVSADGGSEVRVRNIALLALIRAY